MALNRASNKRFSTNIWPGFVDALATLLMVMIFVLTIALVVQSVLRDQITSKDDEIALQDQQLATQDQRLSAQEQRLGVLGSQVAQLTGALTASEDEAAALGGQLADAEAEARRRAAEITRLSTDLTARRQQLAAQEQKLAQTGQELEQAQSRMSDFEAEVAALIAAREAGTAQAATREAELQSQLAEEQRKSSAAELAVAAARDEIDAQAEQARLAAARRDALQALIADLRSRGSGAAADQAQLQTALSEAEAARLAESEAAKALRARLESADSELTAMTLSLEESRRKAEETLTLLAAAEAARERLGGEIAEKATEAEQQAALLATARAELAKQEDLSAEGQRRVALLNEQVASLTGQLGRLQAALDSAGEGQETAELRVAELGQQLNAALLRTSEERQARLALEQQAREAAEAEAKDLARYRSEFFGRLSQILQGREGVEVVGDRFVFSSEVLFQPGEAALSEAGRTQVRNVTGLLDSVSSEIPPEIDWIIRVDGHTDNLPLSGTGRYRDNWELSQARALAVVRYMIDELGFPAGRVAATGFADTRPVAAGDTPEARALNRRIELKLTER
ncbi:peptidoglycan -binding protein [Paracoccus zhejiangensis]|uniref:Flagellar motor protein n=1 Tax=Paracoccus zhejiangensis TaxID=1077935 RepID=A0A2H5EWE7_9RHOB|nr:peptidoglycan -binding protein [Paracoccus zhejiangensis]AUH63636.1 flagellar motor protein [Paracoccus zhejiangensis]